MPESRGVLALRDVIYLVATVLLGASAALGVCALVGLAFRDGSALPLGASAAVGLLVGGAGRLFTRVPGNINFREAFVTVTFSWVAVALVGALPYLLAGTISHPAGALFESMSGFTTTGSTILVDIESAAPGILLWRSVTQWLGGMGFIVLGVAVLPYLGVGGMQLFRLESPGPTTDRLRPRIRETAKLLWFVYIALTVVLMVLFRIGGMSAYDAVNHALTTMPTGGFSTRNDSMAAFSGYIQWVTIVFMYLAGTSFTLHYRALSRGGRSYWRDTEWRLYTGIIVVGTMLVAILTSDRGVPLEQLVRDSMFQIVAIVTTTGYGSSDFALWMPGAQIVLFLLFFV